MWLVTVTWDRAVIDAQITHKMNRFRMSVVFYFDLFLVFTRANEIGLIN